MSEVNSYPELHDVHAEIESEQVLQFVLQFVQVVLIKTVVSTGHELTHNDPKSLFNDCCCQHEVHEVRLVQVEHGD